MTEFAVWWLIAGLYGVGAVGTAVYNLLLIVGPVNYPLSVLRNAVLWPIFLPILIVLSRD